MVEALVADGEDEPFRERVCARRAHRGLDDLDADRGEHLVEAGSELGVSVADEEIETPAGIVEIGSEVACDLGHPCTARVGGDAKDMDDASLELDHEQHVVAAEQHRVDMEEVGGHDALGLGRKELGPDGTRAPVSRWETVPAQHRRDARLRHGDAELCELADDPELSPSGVLPRELADQLDGLVGKGRTTRPPVRVGPAPADERTVPTEDRLRRDEEQTPALARHETSEEGDKGSVGPGEAGTGNLAAKHSQLMAEHEDLGFLRRAV